MSRRVVRRCAALALLAGLPGCSPSDPGPTSREPRTAPTHAEYTAVLTDAGLDKIALGRDWLAAAARALDQPIPVTVPFAETGYLPPDQPAAVGYRVELRRGRRLTVDVTFESAQPGTLFVDLFELRDGNAPRRVAGLAPGETTFEYDVRRDALHVLRVQPELLRGGRYAVSQRTLASLAPPVPGFHPSTVRSGFGAPRDAGTRDHHGIDIFRPRGTPVVAAADGYARTDETPRGGRVVWLRDERTRRNLYYAHLDDWAIASGTLVRAGDVLGYVGNTGNARTTPPHLHFGVYDRGPSDPVPYLQRDDATPARLTVPIEALGRWMRVGARTAPLRVTDPSALPDAPRSLRRGAVVRVIAAAADSYRIALPDGTGGLMRARDLVEASPVASAAPPGDVRESPRADAPLVDTLDEGIEVGVLGRFQQFDLIRLPDARLGWIAGSR